MEGYSSAAEITGTITADAGTNLLLSLTTLTSTSVLDSTGTLRLQYCQVDGSFSCSGNTEIDDQVSFEPPPSSRDGLLTFLGSLTIDTGGELQGTGYPFVVDGLLTMNSGSALDTSSSVEADGGLMIEGGLSIIGTALEIGSAATCMEGAYIGLDSGGVLGIESNESFTCTGDVTVTSDVGTGVFGNDGIISVGTLTIGSGVSFSGGTVDGNVMNSGQILAGSALTPYIVGNYTQTALGSLNVQLGASPFYPLSVTGTASLSGSLDVTTVGGFVPSVGATFQVLTAEPGGAVSGNFTSLSGLVIQSVILSPTVNATGVVLTAGDATNELFVHSIIQSLANNAPPSGASITLQATSTGSLTAAATAVAGVTQNTQNPARLTVTLDLSNTTYHSVNIFSGATEPIYVTAPPGVAVTLNGPASGRATLYDTVTTGAVSVRGNVGNPIFFWGFSPALVVNSGTVLLENVTATTSTDDPTIVVNGGSLVVRDSTIDQSSSYDQPAIQINGGSVDLGTPTDLGGNTINADGTSQLIENTTSTPVSIADDYFTVNGVSVPINLTVINTAGGGLGSLPYAILEANSDPGSAGSVINFDPTVFATPQTITLSSTLVLSESDGPEVIQGPGASLLTISGNNSVEVFQVNSGTTASLSALTVTAGSATNGGGINNAGSLTVTDSTVASNNASNSGGGINNAGALTINNGTITGNGASNGAGINNSGKLTVTDSTIAGNGTSVGYSTVRGGGIYNSGTATAVNSTIAGNNALRAGGGIYVRSAR